MTSLNSYWEPIHTAAYFNNYDSLREELDSGISPNLIMNNLKKVIQHLVFSKHSVFFYC